MTYLIYTAVAVLAVLFVFGMLVAAEEKAHEPSPQEAPHEEHPELAPDIYAGALAYLLIDAELRGLSCLRESATVMTRQGKGQGYERGATNTNPGPCSIVVGIERCSSRESNGKGYHAHLREHTRRAVGSLPAGWYALWGLTGRAPTLDGGHGHYPASRGRDRAYTAAPSKPDRLSPHWGRDES